MTHVARLGELDFRDLPGRRAADPLAGAGADGVTVRLVRVPPGPRSPHVHPDSLEVIHVAEGSGRHYQAGAPEPVRAGDTVLVPAGVEHATVADEPLLLVCFFPHPDPFATTTELPGELA
jgi:quercetin dioxygenase-like cupin family protein